MSYYSQMSYIGGGTDRQFAVPPYISKDHINPIFKPAEGVYPVPPPIDPPLFTWINASTIELSEPIPAGYVLWVIRSSSPDQKLVDFTDGALITEEDLDMQASQAFYLCQEVVDVAQMAREDVDGVVQRITLDFQAQLNDTEERLTAADAGLAAQISSVNTNLSSDIANLSTDLHGDLVALELALTGGAGAVTQADIDLINDKFSRTLMLPVAATQQYDTEFPVPEAGTVPAWGNTPDPLGKLPMVNLPISQEDAASPVIVDSDLTATGALITDTLAVVGLATAGSLDVSGGLLVGGELAVGGAVNLNGVTHIHHPSLSVSQTYSGDTIVLIAGEALIFGEAVYVGTDGKAYKADCNTSGTMPCIGVAVSAAALGATITVLLRGIVREDGVMTAHSKGLPLYVLTPGDFSSVRPSGTGQQVQVVGVPLTNDIYIWNPSLVLVEI